MAWEHSHSTGFPPATRRVILRSHPTCRCTGCPRCSPTGCRRPSTEADHIVEKSRGGTDDVSNGQGLCSSCHQHKTLTAATAARRTRTTKRPPERHPGLR